MRAVGRGETGQIPAGIGAAGSVRQEGAQGALAGQVVVVVVSPSPFPHGCSCSMALVWGQCAWDPPQGRGVPCEG